MVRVDFVVVVLVCFVAVAASAVRLETSSPFVASSWRRIDRSPGDHVVTLHVMLKQPRLHEMMDLLKKQYDRRSPLFGKYLSIAEVREYVSAPQEDLDVVLRWLNNFGAETSVVATGDMIEAKLHVSEAERMLDTRFFTHEHLRDGRVINRAPHYSVPKEIADHVDLIGGVVRFPGELSVEASLKNVNDDDDLTTPEGILDRYGVTIPYDEAYNVQAIASFLEQYVNFTDLAMFFDLAKVPDEKVEKVVGPNDESKPGTEASLDIQYLMGITQNIRTWIWSTAGRREENEPFLKWLYDVSNCSDPNGCPYLYSISYQDYEDTVSPEYMDRVDAEFAKGATMGITYFTGSGDWGTGCTDDCKKFRPDFPSSSPHIVSTGATLWKWQDGKVVDEIGQTWSSGGFSDHFPRPDYQIEPVVEFLAQSTTPESFFNATGRAFPDVGAIGTDFMIVVNGKQGKVGGTSAATPTFAALVSMLNSYRMIKGKYQIGWANPFLYWAYSQNPSSYLDIVEGQNQYGCCSTGFECLKGWDPITGLGVPNFKILLQLALEW